MSQIWPYLVIGLFSGAVYALAAMGLVLTYKTSGIFNFAYGAVAMFCAYTFWKLREAWGLPQWISIPLLVVVVAPLLGVILEGLFRTAIGLSAEIQLVMALGILAFLQALAPRLYGDQDRRLTSIFPTSTFSIGSLHVGYDQLGTLLLTIAFGGMLWLLIRRTRFGLATQAVVDNADLAELIGVSSRTVSRAAWVVSTMFAALVGVLLSASQGLDTYVLVIVVVAAFAPAVLGRLVSLPWAFAGAIALGVAQSFIGKYGSHGTIADIESALPYIALFALLVFYGRGLKEVRSSLKTVTGTGPTSSRRRLLTQGAMLAIAGLCLPLVIHGSLLRDASAALVFAAVGVTLVVLTGWAGQISLCQFTFVGVGAFTVGHLAAHAGNGFLPVAVLGALIAVPLGIIVGLPSLRLAGLFLALATLAFALIMDDVVWIQGSISGGYTGINVDRPVILGLHFDGDVSFFYLTLALFAVYAVAATALRRGAVGRRLQMMRDSPIGASTFGVNLTLTKLAVFAGCGAAAAFAGAFYAVQKGTVNPGDFAFSASLELVLLVVLGGRSLVAGAMIGGAVYMFQLLPIGASIEHWVPLGVAVGVILLAQYPEGTIQVANARIQRYSALFRPRPRPAGELAPGPAPAPAPAPTPEVAHA